MTKSRRSLVLLVAVLAGVGVFQPATRAQGPRLPAMVVIVRHAEKMAEPAENPPLTAEGRERATALATALERAEVGAIITTQWERTKQTAAPVASMTHLVPQIVGTEGTTAEHAASIAAAVRQQVGKVVLVVGHSDTLPAIISALAGTAIPAICSSEFDDLFVLVPVGERWRLIHSRYGAASPRGACR